MQHLKGKKINNQKGTTLVEVLIALLVVSIGVLSSLAYFAAANRSTAIARDITIATTHGEYVLEQMRSLPALSNITGTNWDDWTKTTGLNTLSNETITVAFADASADPLNVQTTVSWLTNGRTHTVAFTTEMTK